MECYYFILEAERLDGVRFQIIDLERRVLADQVLRPDNARNAFHHGNITCRGLNEVRQVFEIFRLYGCSYFFSSDRHSCLERRV